MGAGRRTTLAAGALVLAIGAASCGGNDPSATASRAVRAAAGDTGAQNQRRLAVTALDDYGDAARAHPGDPGLADLRMQVVGVTTRAYPAVEDTVAYGATAYGRSCATPLAPAPPGTDRRTIGDPRALTYAVAEIGKSATALRRLKQAALAAATPAATGPPPIPALQALGFVVRAGDDNHDLFTHDLGELNRWTNTTFPLGAFGTPAERANDDATRAIEAGSRQAEACAGVAEPIPFSAPEPRTAPASPPR